MRTYIPNLGAHYLSIQIVRELKIGISECELLYDVVIVAVIAKNMYIRINLCMRIADVFVTYYHVLPLF